MPILCKCKICNKEFYKRPSDIKNGSGKHCSIKCRSVTLSRLYTGTKLSDEHKRKISNSNKGKKCPYSAKNLLDYMANRTNEQIKIRNHKASQSLKGHRGWNKGKRFTIIPDELKVTPMQNSIRRCRNYSNWRKAVFERDDYTCQKCNQRGGRLNAEHIKPFALILYENDIKSLRQSYLCNALWDMSNAITLCEKCHRKTETYGKRVLPKWQEAIASIL